MCVRVYACACTFLCVGVYVCMRGCVRVYAWVCTCVCMAARVITYIVRNIKILFYDLCH